VQVSRGKLLVFDEVRRTHGAMSSHV
jgi:hypothetical protein